MPNIYFFLALISSLFFNVPDPRDATIYQVNIRAFSKSGNLSGVAERLDSIKALGANVIYLMPIFPVGELKSVNSPYCVKDYLSVNPEFGTLADLRNLVALAHEKKLAVILDWVANHTSYDHTWIKNKAWYKQDNQGNIISPPNTGWRDVAQLDFSNNEMRSAMIQAMKYWVLTTNIDGFRCDYSDGVPFDFWKQALDTLKSLPNRKLIMLSEGTRKDHFNAGFDYNFGFRFFENLQKIYKHNGSVVSIDSLNNIDDNLMIRYTTNHDVNSSDGTPSELFGGENGAMAAFVIVSYMKSIPMIYNGQEVGTPYRIKFPFTNDHINWTVNPHITAQYKKIIGFRNKSAAIRRGKLTSYSNEDVCAFTKELANDRVLVLVNLRPKEVSYATPKLLVNTTWQNALSNQQTLLGTEISLKPYSYLVLQK